MKFCGTLLLLLLGFSGFSQSPRIHAHNDYQKQEPLYNALRNKVYSVEADVYLVGDSLRVAHDPKDRLTAPSLISLYLQPIADLFAKHRGHIAADPDYAPILMIDVKENGPAAIAQLARDLSGFPGVFDRSVNSHAVQIVISGERGPIESWTQQPANIQFDGRPYEIYDSATLARVAFVSDSYLNYTRPKDSIDAHVRQLAEKSHAMGKLLRLWAIPDNPDSWRHLLKLGVDIINTDRVSECRASL